jgi:hypothetical protein
MPALQEIVVCPEVEFVGHVLSGWPAGYCGNDWVPDGAIVAGQQAYAGLHGDREPSPRGGRPAGPSPEPADAPRRSG